MRKTLLVAQREVLETVKTKGFWIGILLFPVLLVLSIGAPIFLERAKSVRTYAVRDSSGWLANAIEREATLSDARRLLLEAQRRQLLNKDVEALPPVLARLAPVLATLPPSQLDSAARAIAGEHAAAATVLPDSAQAMVLGARTDWRAWWDTATARTVRQFSSAAARARYKRVPADGDLNARVRDGELFAYFEIGKDPVQDNSGATYVARNLADDDLREWYQNQATDLVRQRRLERERISRQTAAWLSADVRFTERTVSESGEQTAVQMKDKLRQNAPVVFVYFLWFSIFATTQGLLTNTIEEKSTRISEVMLSSISAVQLMAGKILGVAFAGLMTIVTWLVSGYVSVKFLPRALGAPATLDLTPILTDAGLMASFVVYFVLGYLLYAALLLALGSTVNTIQEAQSLMTPVILMLMLPLLAMIPIARDPNGTLARALSFIPPFTPFVMMNRAAGPPTLLEYVATTVLLLVAIAFTLWASAKIFRIGILMTGKPPKARDILQWVRAPVGAMPVRREE